MATGIIQTQLVTTFVFDSGDSGIGYYGHGVYDRNTGLVRVYLSARNTSADITTSSILATIPEGYRPKTNVTRAPCICRSANGTVTAYHATINTSGQIKQNLGSTVREVFLVYEYSVL